MRSQLSQRSGNAVRPGTVGPSPKSSDIPYLTPPRPTDRPLSGHSKSVGGNLVSVRVRLPSSPIPTASCTRVRWLGALMVRGSHELTPAIDGWASLHRTSLVRICGRPYSLWRRRFPRARCRLGDGSTLERGRRPDLAHTVSSALRSSFSMNSRRCRPVDSQIHSPWVSQNDSPLGCPA